LCVPICVNWKATSKAVQLVSELTSLSHQIHDFAYTFTQN